MKIEDFKKDALVHVRKQISIDKTYSEITIEEIIQILGITIQKDEDNKLVTFLCMLAAFTEDSQFNISYNSPSSTGKTFIPTEISSLFPSEDVIALAYTSPTSFFHANGIYDKERNVIIVDLSRKILIFQDQPHNQLLERLRPLLSHDQKVLRAQITDKTQKYGTKTKQVEIKGYPSVIFCSAGMNIDEQESTRFILLSPQMSQEKLKASIVNKVNKEADIDEYREHLLSNKERELLKERILAIRSVGIESIKFKEYQNLVIERYFSNKPTLKPSHQRDIGKIISIIKALALLNLWTRNKKDKCITVSESDITTAFNLWDRLSESQDLNLPPYIYNFYWDVIVSLYKEKSLEENGIKKQEIMSQYKKVYGSYVEDWKLRQEILPMLETAGLIIEEKSKKDGRTSLYIPLYLNKQAINSELSGGEDNSILVEELLTDNAE